MDYDKAVEQMSERYAKEDKSLMAMGEEEFRALHEAATQHQNRALKYYSLKCQTDRVAFLRKGGTYQQWFEKSRG